MIVFLSQTTDLSHFIHDILRGPLLRWIFSSLIYRWGNRGSESSERLSKLSKITQKETEPHGFKLRSTVYLSRVFYLHYSSAFQFLIVQSCDSTWTWAHHWRLWFRNYTVGTEILRFWPAPWWYWDQLHTKPSNSNVGKLVQSNESTSPWLLRGEMVMLNTGYWKSGCLGGQICSCRLAVTLPFCKLLLPFLALGCDTASGFSLIPF
jgi:hypothetical protein